MSNELVKIVEESGLEKTKAQFLLDNFEDYFSIASEWEKKAKSIIVTDISQVTEMKMAREARLFLAKKRCDVERARKELKAQSLREGKAIDGIANVLKALLIPIEEHLTKQEKFAEIKEEERQAELLAEAEAKAERERIAKEKADEAEREKIRLENIKLKEEAEKHAKELAKREAEKVAIEKKAKAEREKRERVEAEKQAIIEAQEEKERAEKEEAELQATEQKKTEELKKYKAFLSKHGCTKETRDQYFVQQSGKKVTLYKEIDSIIF